MLKLSCLLQDMIMKWQGNKSVAISFEPIPKYLEKSYQIVKWMIKIYGNL